MKKILFFALLLLSGISAQSQKLECFVLGAPDKPLPNVTRIAVLDFSGRDHKGAFLANCLVSSLLSENRGIYNITGLFSTKEGKTYVEGGRTNIYTLIDRSQMEAILNEQNFSVSGLVDDSKAVELGKLLAADAIITGSASYTYKDENSASEYKDKDGRVHRSECTKRTTTASGTFKVLSTKTGEILATNTFSYTSADSKCDEKRSGLESPSVLADNCFKSMGTAMANYIAPSYRYSKFVMKKIKVEQFKTQIKEATAFLENAELDKAFQVYKAVYDADNYNAEAAYNLGILYEVVGDYPNASHYYGISQEIDGKEEDYLQAKRRAESGVRLLEQLKTLNCAYTIHDYAGVGESATVFSQKINTKGSKSDRHGVYEGPDLKSKVVAMVPGATEFVVLEDAGTFYLIKLLGGKQGYISKKLVK
jgi:hypothetical protein